MKLLTVAIPCYNSQDYMETAIRTVLVGGEDVEILLIDDGSTDRTGEIADSYEKKYPDQVRVIHQENKGHGGAVNTGLREAGGRYFKVLDSDDWFDREAFLQVLDVLREMTANRKAVDMFLCNYVYDKVNDHKKKSIGYTNVLPVGHVFTWRHCKHFKMSQNILMHSVIYRTKMLRHSGMVLPEHTFYVDNLFVYNPLPHVKTLYYMDVDLYHYFIGREDQSVNEKVMMGRIDQQVLVNRLMIDAHDLTKIKNEPLQNYMVKYLGMILLVSTSLLVKIDSEESLKTRDELWDYLKRNPGMYKLVNKRTWCKLGQMRSGAGQSFIRLVYTLAQKFFGFN
ncbi:MAG: glycosyltransferase family 2 protein [Eubacterium sp.]|nr:glycosyltransferase family 2 protein [Eubacterium sp.]